MHKQLKYIAVLWLGISLTIIPGIVQAQDDESKVYGYVYDPAGEMLPKYPIYIDGKPIVQTNEQGYYEVYFKPNTSHTLKVDYFGDEKEFVVKISNRPKDKQIDFKFTGTTLGTTEKEVKKRKVTVVDIDPITTVIFPSLQMEDAVSKIGLGIRKRSELSATYNVRGGNFDENLIYVNDIEVYRPFFARSGQQEGLSFVNPFMTSNINFSSGGFAARYGDKLSSVLDVTYNKPKDFGGSAEVSMLGASLQLQDRLTIAKRKDRFTYLIGARYRSLQYLLGTLDVSGDYRPTFIDFQGMFTYNVNTQLSLTFFSTYANNKYVVEPQSRETNFGTVQQAIRLFVGFAGAERIEYETQLNAITLAYKPDDRTTLKWITSAYSSKELEHFTIEGGYRLDELETNLGSDNFAEARAVLGYGYFINHARNNLNINVQNTRVIYRKYSKKHHFEAGAKLQREVISDYLNEWNYNDSSSYRINRANYPAHEIHLDDVLKGANDLSSIRAMGYVQDEYYIGEFEHAQINFGVRANHWSINNQVLISPRMSFAIEPNKIFNERLKRTVIKNYEERSDSLNLNYLKTRQLYDSLKKRDIKFKLAAGVYSQPPFYRELRNPQGILNLDLKAQTSIHFVAGSDLLFNAWNRPFRFIQEAYYKHMDNLVPYTINNVKLRYDAVNSSKGYAVGYDARVNGEFIKGLESWVNLSLLSTRENITYMNEIGEPVETGFIRRPTDQRVNFSILFQDEFPLDTTFKIQLNLVIGSELPYYFNGPFRYSENYALPAYRRVDIGFSKEIKRFTKQSVKAGPLNSLWLSLDVFNILQVNNVASYIWVTDLNNNIYGVPNYLTGRRLNVRLIGKF